MAAKLHMKPDSMYKLTFESFSLTQQYHSELNPLIWDSNDVLLPSVRVALLKIADVWQEFAKIPTSKIDDIILTGGNANYNYTQFSDLDVHLILDRDSLGDDRAFVDEYLADKKTLWTLKHSDIRVNGYQVELFAQDMKDHLASNAGIYSLKNNKWISKPTHEDIASFDTDPMLIKKIRYYMRTINRVIKNEASEEEAENLKNKIKSMRGAGIQRAGEYSFENLIFKELRNRGYLDKLSTYLIKNKDRSLSL